MTIKSFDEYFEGYKNYDDGGKLDQVIITDAKKVYETLKTPEAINEFYKASFEKQQEMVKGLDDGHSGFSFSCVCNNAYRYATYAQEYVKEDTTQENISEPKNEEKDFLQEKMKILHAKLGDKLGKTADVKTGEVSDEHRKIAKQQVEISKAIMKANHEKKGKGL